MASDSPISGHQAPEEEIERLAQEMGRLIRGAEPQRREDLKELAYTLIREETILESEAEQTREGSAPTPLNPLGVGVIVLLSGVGLSFIFGPVGLFLIVCGLIFIVWGALISWVKG